MQRVNIRVWMNTFAVTNAACKFAGVDEPFFLSRMQRLAIVWGVCGEHTRPACAGLLGDGYGVTPCNVFGVREVAKIMLGRE